MGEKDRKRQRTIMSVAVFTRDRNGQNKVPVA